MIRGISLEAIDAFVWSGEFGRTPYAQGDDGRDHNNKGFSSWMAGGGVKGGLRYAGRAFRLTDVYGEVTQGVLS